jgi:hypothetical protein
VSENTSPRTLTERFRLSALRRPANASDAASDRRIADEELVHELWSNREVLCSDLKQRLADSKVRTVDLTRVDVDEGVTATFAFSVDRSTTFKRWAAVPALVAAVANVLEYGLAARVSVSATPVGRARSSSSQPWGHIAPILAVIGTGIGVIGFVTFVGGAVVWARLNATHIPSAPALGIIPTQDLVVIGAETLAPQVLIALFIVAVFTLIYYIARHFGTEDWTVKEPNELVVAMAGFVGLALVIMWFVVLAVTGSGPGSLREILIGVGLLLVLTGLAAIIATYAPRWLYLAVAIFLFVAVFQGYLAYTRENSDNRVRGAALIRENKKAIVGLFVAEGTDRVYLARVTEDASQDSSTPGIVTENSRLVGYGKDLVTDVAIGDRKPLDAALVQAVALARELCHMLPQLPPPEKGKIEACRTAAPGLPQPTGTP